jgi:hypothetical protein
MNPIEILKEFNNIVRNVELIELKEKDFVSMWKIKARIYDSSILWIRDVCKKRPDCIQLLLVSGRQFFNYWVG